MPVNVDPKDFLHAFHGLTFPASRSQIVGAAKDTGGLNGDVLLILEQLPERMYVTAKDLTDAIQRTQVTTDGGTDVQPAAPSAISDAHKELVSTMADPRRGDVAADNTQAQRISARDRELTDDTVAAGPAGKDEMRS